ncbi:MAG: GerMN domain-containing protein [Quinella sp. 2Q5]|nr:GerMN domain-containing protein [Quinella sp. 2Q5]
MKNFFVPAMLALLLLTAGCDKPPANPSDKPETTKPVDKPAPKSVDKPTAQPEAKPIDKSATQPVERTPEDRVVTLHVYYPDDSGMRLVEVEREIVIDDNTDKYTAAVEILREDPTEENLTRIFPDNAYIRSVTVRDGLALVDFDGSILKGFVGGSTGEEFLIGSIVETLTNFPEVTAVKFLVDGQEIETLSGHMDLSTPLGRKDILIE